MKLDQNTDLEVVAKLIGGTVVKDIGGNFIHVDQGYGIKCAPDGDGEDYWMIFFFEAESRNDIAEARTLEELQGFLARP